MPHITAAVQAAFLMSVIKPILFAAVLIGWGYLVSKMSQDAGFYRLRQQEYNSLYIGSVLLSIALMLYIPIFIAGFIVGILLAYCPFLIYVRYRNANVPESAKWDLSVSRITGKIDERKRRRAQEGASLVLLTADNDECSVPLDDETLVAGHLLFAQVMDFALPRNAERIGITVAADKAQVNTWIDGASYLHSKPDRRVALRLIDYIKEGAGLEEDHRKKQEGQLKIRSESFGKHTLDIETAGSTRMVKMMLWPDRSDLDSIKLDELGLLDSQKQALEATFSKKGGIVLVASPPGQGRTTTCYSLLQSHDPYTQSIRTLEDDKPFDAEGVGHNEFLASDSPEDVRRKLAGLIRGDPDVMMITRIPDRKTAELVAQSGEEIRFYLPMQAGDLFTAMDQWIKTVGSRSMAAEHLQAVLAQRLVRKLCQTCRRPYKPDSAALKKLNLPSKVKKLYQASGKVMVNDKPQVCPTCQGLGYRGRMGIYEVLTIDSQARAFIVSNEMDKLRSYMRKQKSLWLQEAGLSQVVAGKTDIKEVTRAVSIKTKQGTSGASDKNKKQPSDEKPADKRSE